MDATGAGERIEEFLRIMERLSGPDGCPWDRAQSHRSLKRYLIEEAYEVYEAIEEDDAGKLRDELGDVLLQVVFHSEIARRAGTFTFSDVVGGVHQKMIRRHPHIFSSGRAKTAREVERNWEAIKEAEKEDRGTPGRMDVPKAMDPLYRAEKIQGRAAQAGFDWPDASGVLEKIREECGELGEAIGSGSREAVEEEIGDLFFSLVNLCRFAKVDPADALQQANDKFVERYRAMESEARRQGRPLETLSPGEQEALWQQAKMKKNGQNGPGT